MALEQHRRSVVGTTSSVAISRWPWLVLLGSLAASAFVTGLVFVSTQQRDAGRFQNQVVATRDRIQSRLDTYEALLRATAALHAAQGGGLTRDTFHRFVSLLDLRNQYRGIHGIGFARRLNANNRQTIVEQARREGFPGFMLWPAGANTTTVVYLEPLDARNRAAIGFDMFSEPVRRAAMEHAWHTGSPALSGRVLLKQEISGPKRAGFLLYVPVFVGGVTPRSKVERLRQLDGFVYGAFRAGDVFHRIFGSDPAPRISFRVYDGEVRPEKLLHDAVGAAAASSSFQSQGRLQVAGRSWVLEYVAQPAFERHRLTRLVPGIALSGLVVSLALFLLAQSRARARIRSESARTRECFLLRLEDTLRTIAEPDEIVATCARVLVEYMAVTRCAYAEVGDDEDTFTLVGDYARDLPPLVGRYKLSQFGAEALRLSRARIPYVVHDLDKDPRVSASERDAYRAMGISAVISVTLHKHERIVAGMAVHQGGPRAWTSDEVELVSSVASRCWESLERARGAKALRESEQRFRNMADHAPVMLWISDSAGACTYLNRPFFEFTGRTGPDVQQGWLSAVHPEDSQAVRQCVEEANRAQQPLRLEFRLRRHDGVYRWAIAAAAPRFDELAGYVGYIGSIIDITERKQGEEERERLLRQAEEAVRVRDDFLSIASHELKTPITALSFQSANIRNLTHGVGSVPCAALEQRLQAINRQTSRLTSLVEDLLDVSRIASGHLHVQLEMVDLCALVREELPRLTPVLERAGCSFALHAPASLEAWVDPVRTQQVLCNLLENASRYGAGRPVEVRLESSQGRAVLSVRDQGIGIALEDQRRIFDRFERATSSKHYGGLGLGLWITRQIVSFMGGTISVESRPGAGATFTVSMPSKPAARTGGRLPKSAPAH